MHIRLSILLKLSDQYAKMLLPFEFQLNPIRVDKFTWMTPYFIVLKLHGIFGISQKIHFFAGMLLSRIGRDITKTNDSIFFTNMRHLTEQGHLPVDSVLPV